MSKITLNIVEPSSSTPINPGTDPIVPNTGLFTHGISGPEATIITVSIVVVLAIVAAAVLYYKHNKTNKTTKLTNAINVAKHKKKVSIPLAALALVVSLGTLAALLVNAGKSNTSAADGGLTVKESSEDLTIEVGNEPVFAVLPVELTVAEATDAGYTLTAYTDSTDIVSTTDESNKIPMVAIPEEDLSQYTTLTDNTWGLSLEQPQDENSEVYTSLSTDQSNPTILKTIDDYSETEENDTTTIYYGFYITPDVPYGTYEGSDITYSATPSYITTLSFNGNGNDGGEAIGSIIIPAGTTITLPENTYTKDGYHFTGWNTNAEGTGEAYADEAEYAAIAGESANVTLYAQWEENILYMQDVATWGSSLSIGDEVVAVDNRDDKEYYVARLADGNIWMTQNLDLDLSSQTTLTPENTNISANWTPANSTIAFAGTSVSGWGNNTAIPYSADPGALYIYSSGTTDNDEQFTSLEACQTAHPDCNAHSHAGNYYNWPAAVASNNASGIAGEYQNAPNSICPAGWRLPVDRNAESLTEGNEFDALITSQDGITGERPNSCPPDGLCPYYSYKEKGFNEIRTSPLHLTRSGSIDNSLNDVGSKGTYWSSTSASPQTHVAFLLYFDSNYVYPAKNETGYHGYPVRCLAE